MELWLPTEVWDYVFDLMCLCKWKYRYRFYTHSYFLYRFDIFNGMNIVHDVTYPRHDNCQINYQS